MLRVGLVLLFLVSGFASAQLTVSDATVRLLPPGVPNTSGYLTIHNSGDSDRILVSAAADFVSKVEIHNHVMSGEVMRMVKQDEVIIPAGESVHFKPGGLHLMFFGLQSPLAQGQQVNIILHTEDGEALGFTAEVTMPGEEKGHHHH